MPIQFRCTQCQQPIEVDDEHAGQAAACPYCQALVTVPSESTFRPDGAVVARPLDERVPPAPPAPPAGLRPPYIPAPRRQAANTFGKYALICTILAVILFAVYLIAFMTQVVPALGGLPTGQLDQDEIERLQEAMSKHPWVVAVQFGVFFFTLVGLVLGIVSLAQNRHGNWRGVTAVVLCGMYIVCVCGGTLLLVSMGVAGVG